MAKTIGFFIYPDHQLLDLSGPLCAFQIATMYVTGAYRLRVISATGGLVKSSVGLAVESEASAGIRLDTLIVVGGRGSRALDEAQLAAIMASAKGVRRLSSVCTGAFALAQCGLLEGVRVTTHWRHTASLQRDYPGILVDGDRIFIRDGKVWTSAGISAGIDLALALIEDDLGTAISRSVAQEMVVYHRRAGGQTQFSELVKLEPKTDRIRVTLSYIREHLSADLSVERLAEQACLSVRQFARCFRSETGESAAKAVERMRVEVARERVENSREPIEQIAVAVGFSDPERMRRAFLRLYGQPPQAFRRNAKRV